MHRKIELFQYPPKYTNQPWFITLTPFQYWSVLDCLLHRVASNNYVGKLMIIACLETRGVRGYERASFLAARFSMVDISETPFGRLRTATG